MPLIIFDIPAADTTYLCVMRQDVHASVATTEKRAQDPANDRNDDGTPEGTPKRIDMETNDNTRHDKEQQAVKDQNEKPKR